MLTVPLLAAFTSLRGFPWWFAIAFNNANPLFQVGEDTIRFRVFRVREHPLADVESVEVRRSLASWAVTVQLRGRFCTFGATVRDALALRGALELLSHSVTLGPGARAVLKSDTALPRP
jgi:hypothetical protein